MIAALAYLALHVDSAAVPPPATDVFDPVAARAEHLGPGEPREMCRKEEWFQDKALRPDVHLSDADLSRWTTADSRGARTQEDGAQRACPSSTPRSGQASGSSR